MELMALLLTNPKSELGPTNPKSDDMELMALLGDAEAGWAVGKGSAHRSRGSLCSRPFIGSSYAARESTNELSASMHEYWRGRRAAIR
jgi:hypothetical protein